MNHIHFNILFLNLIHIINNNKINIYVKIL